MEVGTWRWGTPDTWGNPHRWGNPPVYMISHLNLARFTWYIDGVTIWEIIWTGGLSHLIGFTSPTWGPPTSCKQALSNGVRKVWSIFTHVASSYANRPFPSSKNSHIQNEGKCNTFLVKMSFICKRIKNYFHVNGFSLSLALKQRLGATRKWPKYCDKRKHSHKKRVPLSQNWFGTPTWPPFLLFWETNIAAVTSPSFLARPISLSSTVVAIFNGRSVQSRIDVIYSVA